MKTQTLKQLIKVVSKNLNQLTKQAAQFYKQSCEVVEVEHKSKILAKRKHRYSLNPHRIGRLFPEEVRDKHLRKEAREVERKLKVALANLLTSKQVVNNSNTEVRRLTNLVIHSLQAIDETLQIKLPKWLTYTQDQAKLVRYERRRELELNEKIFGTGPAKVTSTKTRTKGDLEMSKKSVTVKELLGKLEKTQDPTEKRTLRVKLRKLGHEGGLGKGPGRPKKVTKKVTKKKKKKTAPKETQ